MTPPPTARETDRQCAQALGYTVTQTPATESHSGEQGLYWLLTMPDGGFAEHARAWKSDADAWNDVPHFSTDIGAAWTLLDWLKKQDANWEYVLSGRSDEHYCTISKGAGDQYMGEGDTPAAAIVAAFLNVHEGG